MNAKGKGTEQNAPLTLSKLVRSAGASGAAALPPVHLWDPSPAIDIGLRIARDGTWFHCNSPIQRKSLVRLFSTVLRLDPDGQHYLVTPAEKVIVNVTDAPFLVVEMEHCGNGKEQLLTFRTNSNDVVTCNATHPLSFEHEETSNGLKPYLEIRRRLKGLLTRHVTHELVALGETTMIAGVEQFGVWSKENFFAMARVDAVEQGVSPTSGAKHNA